jgi:hypothetical protein
VSWPITRDDVVAQLGAAPRDADLAAVDRAVAAAVAWVEAHVLTAADDGSYSAGPDVELGAVMLAARWYQRRSTPGGYQSFAELGPAYVMRSDPDVALLLGLGIGRVG